MTVRLKQLPVRFAFSTTLADEEARLAELYRMQILDALSEERFERYTKLLAETLEMPLAFAQLIGREKVWFKSSSEVRLTAVHCDFSLRAQAVGEEGPMIVTDASSDPRFAGHPAVGGDAPVRFYAGTSLRNSAGQVIGTCCVIDHRCRELSRVQIEFLRQTAELVEREIQDREIVVELRETIKDQALLDPFTELPNQTLFCGYVDRELQRGGASKPHVVAAIRLNRYGVLDGALGRLGAACAIGDVARRIRDLLGGGTIVGHIREDELAVSLPYFPGQSGAQAVLGLLAECFRRAFVIGGESFIIPVSIGASRYPEDAGNAADLLRKARIALRSARATDELAGQLYSPRLSTQTDREFRLESALTRGIERKEFRVAFQPKVSLATRRVSGAEALLRWKSAELGDISPEVFIPIADRIGVLDELVGWVIEEVLRYLTRWRRAGIDGLQVSINVSGTQLRQRAFARRLVGMLEAWNVSGRKINLEITEGSLIDDIELAIDVMSRLREHAVTFSIDDFGTGFSSLSYLGKMPLSVLKIDRSFIQNIPASQKDMMIANSVIALGHGLGLTVVAEGAENFEQVDFLSRHGCDEVQGFAFCKPLPAVALERLLLKNPRFCVAGDGEPAARTRRPESRAECVRSFGRSGI
jgi:EAL domain-containing protein (putative c-di-GMP-specific phosphodiesterase class I)/GGDEF domain-containing protein